MEIEWLEDQVTSLFERELAKAIEDGELSAKCRETGAIAKPHKFMNWTGASKTVNDGTNATTAMEFAYWDEDIGKPYRAFIAINLTNGTIYLHNGRSRIGEVAKLTATFAAK